MSRDQWTLAAMSVVRREFRNVLLRWMTELRATDRSTLAVGMVTKCWPMFEAILRQSAAAACTWAGEEGPIALRRVGGGKAVNALTPTECLKIILLANSSIQKTGSASQLITAREAWIIQEVIAGRNDFSHNNTPDNREVLAWLNRAYEVSELELLRRVEKYQQER